MNDEDKEVTQAELEAHGQQTLLDVAPDWAKHWQGMPDFKHRDLTPWQSVVIHFRNLEDRQGFARLLGQTITGQTRSLWYPKAEIWRYVDKRYRAVDDRAPKYPIYVPTKGRWESALTIKALEKMGVDYFAVIQPQEVSNYKGVVKNGQILILPSGLDGLVPTRNWIKDHSIELGAERHWQIDDNINGFFRFHENLKVEVESGSYFRAMEDFADRYENIVICGPQYFMFASRKSGNIPALVINTRVYSCSLVSNLFPYRWRGVYNDDTDICLRVLKDGLCTVQFNAFLSYKMTTMTVKGGNTPIYQGDGRRKMAESLQEQHPDVVTITQKWGRWQHHVNYAPFKRNKLILKEGVKLDGDSNNYGFELIKLDEQSDVAPVPQESDQDEAIRNDSPSERQAKENREIRESVDIGRLRDSWSAIQHHIDEEHVEEHLQTMFPF